MLELKSAHIQIYEEDHEYLKMLSTTHGDFSHIIRSIIRDWVLNQKKQSKPKKKKSEKNKNAPNNNRVTSKK